MAGLDPGVWQDLTGFPLSKRASEFLRARDEKDFILWTSRRVNIPVVIVAQQPLIIRHNDPEELFSLDVEVPDGSGRVSVAAILGTKISGELRRRMHQLLRDAFKRWKDEINDTVKGIYEGAVYGDVYDCGVYVEVDAKKREERLRGGYCKRCPSCALMGYAVEAGQEINSISRVDKDTFYSTRRLADVMMKVTRNRVDDVAFVTGQSLFEVNVVEPGTVFVGVITLRDATLAETLFTLKAIAEMERVGAAKTAFGGVRTYIPLVAFAEGRLATGYELAGKALAMGAASKDDVVKLVVDTFTSLVSKDQIVSGEIAENLRSKGLDEMKRVIIEAWMDAAERRKRAYREAFGKEPEK